MNAFLVSTFKFPLYEISKAGPTSNIYAETHKFQIHPLVPRLYVQPSKWYPRGLNNKGAFGFLVSTTTRGPTVKYSFVDTAYNVTKSIHLDGIISQLVITNFTVIPFSPKSEIQFVCFISQSFLNYTQPNYIRTKISYPR